MESSRPGAIRRLVRVAAEQRTLEGIREMLRVVTEEMNGWCTLILGASPGYDAQIPKGRLFVLAYWVPDERTRVWHEISLESLAGCVLHTGRAEAAALTDPRGVKPLPRLIVDSGSRYFCLAPMTMQDGSSAVLEVYRVENKPFTDGEVALLDQMAAVFPALYANLTDRVGFEMVDKVSEILRKADQDDTHVAAHQPILDCINEVFASMEASLFLEDRDEEPEVYRLKAQEQAGKPRGSKTEYRRGEGATGYVLERGKTVRIVDLKHYDEDQEWLQAAYPGLHWDGAPGLEESWDDYFHEAEHSPISFVCAPIRAGGAVLGAVRFAGSVRNPFYFDGWQARFLEIAGTRIGAWWDNALHLRRQKQELRSWEALTSGFDAMNRFVQKQLRKNVWDEGSFFRQAMDLAHRVIPHTGNSDVALVEGRELVTVATSGHAWSGHPDEQFAHYALHPPQTTAARLVAERSPTAVCDQSADPPRLKKIFPKTAQLILAPIEAGDSVHGVLSIRSESTGPLPGNTKLIAGLLGQQLGLYHSLALQIRSLQKAEHDNREMIETQAKMLGDVQHQVKSPVISLYRIAQSLLQNALLPNTLKPQISQLRGICSKVAAVVRNMGMFSDLANSKPIRLRRSVLLSHKLRQMLRESCEDQQTLLEPARRIEFVFDEKSLQSLAGNDASGKLDMTGRLVEVDLALLEQCVNNVLDNAGKYSFDKTKVRLCGGIQAGGTEFFISVANEGLEVRPEDIQRLKQRGQRSDRAIQSAGEGSGIGLWIVDEIMRAHGGRLAITPTQNGVTEVRLVFPVVRGLEALSDEATNSLSRR
jgi:signal transduction histidine kinase